MKTIIAPTGAGKTHYIKTHGWLKDLDLVPEVQLAYKRCFNKFGEKWWLNSSALQYKDLLFERLFKVMSKRPGWYATAELKFTTPSTIFVVPRPQILATQTTKRYNLGNHDHPVLDLKSAQSNYELYRKVACTNDCLVFPSFESLRFVSVRQVTQPLSMADFG